MVLFQRRSHPQERALFTKRRKDAYEALHRETKNGATGGGHNQLRQLGEAADRFTSDTAAKTGQSERAVQRDAERGEKLSERTVRDWLSRIDKASKEARNRRIFDMWIACWTADEIAADLDMPVSSVKEIWPKSEDLPFPSKSAEAAASHATDFTPPIAFRGFGYGEAGRPGNGFASGA